MINTRIYFLVLYQGSTVLVYECRYIHNNTMERKGGMNSPPILRYKATSPEAYWSHFFRPPVESAWYEVHVKAFSTDGDGGVTEQKIHTLPPNPNTTIPPSNAWSIYQVSTLQNTYSIQLPLGVSFPFIFCILLYFFNEGEICCLPLVFHKKYEYKH